MIVLISDLDMHGSGYMNIAIGLAKQLTERDRSVTILGFGYKGDEHNWPFRIIPVPTHEAWNVAPGMMQNLLVLGATNQMESPEAIMVALDIPHQLRGLQMPRAVEGKPRIPYMGIFPVESGPLSNSWASIIQPMDSALVISKYGLKMMQDAKLTNGVYLPVGLDAQAWRSVTVEERKDLRKSMGLTDDDFVVLTVADNQERKNLSAAAHGISIAKSKGVPVKWLLVTRVNSQVGWNLPDLANKYGLSDSVQPFERGLPHKSLWVLHAVADAFLLTSKAEGLCMPILEAMSVGTPVMATYCTAIMEHLFEDLEKKKGQRGFPIEVEYVHVDPWGNSDRSYASPDSIGKTLRFLYGEMKGGLYSKRVCEITERAKAYVRARTWHEGGDVLDNELRRAIAKARANASAGAVTGIIQPPTVPQEVPMLVGGGMPGGKNEQAE
jgi:glycosyltransferase involved in cell wall biosynthesis